MAKTILLTHTDLTKALETARIPVTFELVQDLRRKEPEALLARIADASIEAFASREGRGRELAVYLFEAATKELRVRRAKGFTGNLYFPLGTREIEDQTLADSFRMIAGRYSITPESTTFIVPLKDYIGSSGTVLPALMRLRLVGFGISMAIDNVTAPRFRPLAELPITGLCLSGVDMWKKMRTIGPGKLGALGSWIGWAESEGIKRLALDVADGVGEETARLYGFPLASGPYYAAAETAALKQAAN